MTNPLDFGMPEIRISGYTSHVLGGNLDFPLLTTPNQTWIISDNASYLFGTHSLRFGGEFRTGNALSCPYDQPCPILGVTNHLSVPYVYNWNANMEQSLWINAALTAAYVGNKGNRLYSVRDINQNVYNNDTEGDELSGRPYITKFPYLNYIDMLENYDLSINHSLQPTLKQQSTDGLFFVARYTWAHSIDNGSSNRSASVQNSYHIAAERGDSDFDVRNRFTFAATYEPRSKPGYAQLLSRWRFNSIFTAESGDPINFFDDGDDISGTGEYNDRWNLHGNPKNIHWSRSKGLPWYEFNSDYPGTINAACEQYASYEQLYNFGFYAGPGWVITPPEPGQFGTMGRNVVRGPDFVNLDFSVIKTFTLRERMNMELRGEFFNVLNHPNFAGTSGDLYNWFYEDSPSAGEALPGYSTVAQARYTPDIEASNPVVGSGGFPSHSVGVKITW